jgi:hypothetical protein
MTKIYSGTKKGYVWLMGAGITVMLALFAWCVYAEGEITRDVDAVAQAAGGPINPATGKPTFALDDKAIELMKQTGRLVEQNLNDGSDAFLYDMGPLSLKTTPGKGASRAEIMITNHFDSFCATPPAGPETGGNCPKDDPLLQGGDIKVTSITSGTSFDANGNRQKAANQFLFNLIPIPDNNFSAFLQDGKIDISALPTSLDPKDPRSKRFPNPQQQFAQALADEALLSIAREPYAEMMAKRTVPEGQAESHMAIMKRIAVQRLMSPAWHETLKSLKKPEEILKEQAEMQAFQIWLEYERYRQMERVEALLSAIVLQNYNQSKAVAAQFASVPTTGR